jgi:hypothetical protein
MALIRPLSYQVLLTPLVGKDTYGTTIDVSKDIELDDYIKDKGVSIIKREVDNGDFDIGVFVFDSINITAINLDGKFSGINDSRSMFKYSRDKAKVTVNFFDGDSNTPDSSFRGLIDDRATKMNFGKNEIKFKVLSNDSIINRTKVPSGSIASGSLVSTAIKGLLQLSDITSVLNYSDANINVLNDYTIDDGSFFDNLSVKNALDKLLAVSNSVLIIEKDTDNMIVKSRAYNSGLIKRFYGHGDFFGRENIINIKNYNDGLQRAFNTITVNTISRSNSGFIDQYGDNGKTFDFGFITNDNTRAEIADNILSYWKAPKIELELEAKTSEVKNLTFFDLVSIDYPYRKVPFGSSKLPIYGVSKYGTAVYPYIDGNLKISPNMAFKVIGIKEDPKKFISTIKLRQIGTEVDDGFFGKIGTFYGTGIYGINNYQEDFELVDPNRKSKYGAALYGTVVYGLT